MACVNLPILHKYLIRIVGREVDTVNLQYYLRLLVRSTNSTMKSILGLVFSVSSGNGRLVLTRLLISFQRKRRVNFYLETSTSTSITCKDPSQDGSQVW